MKKALRYLLVFSIAFNIFMVKDDVFSYDFIDIKNEGIVNSLKNKIYNIYDSYIKLYKNDSNGINSISGSLCPNGINVDVYRKEGKKSVFDHNETMDFEKYVAGVVAAENAWSEGDNIESMKAQAIAARSYGYTSSHECTTTVKGNESFQAYTDPTGNTKALRAAEETKGMMIYYNGSAYRSEYDAFCVSSYSTSTSSYILRQKSQSIPKSFVDVHGTFCKGTSNPSSCGCNGHGRGMSQIGARYLQKTGYTFDKILEYYYPAGIEIIQAIAFANWQQGDPEWGSFEIAPGVTMKSAGCLITSMATLIAKSGVSTSLGSSFNPGTFAKHIKEHGGINQGKNAGAYQVPAGTMYGLVNHYSATIISDNLSAANIKRYLDQGKYVMVHVLWPTRGGHYMAVDRVEGDEVYLLDPGAGCNRLSDCTHRFKNNWISDFWVIDLK